MASISSNPLLRSKKISIPLKRYYTSSSSTLTKFAIKNSININLNVSNNNVSLLSVQNSKFKNICSKSSPDEQPDRECRGGDNFPPPNGGGVGGGGGDGGEDDYKEKEFGPLMKFILTRYLDLKGSGSALRNEFKVVLKTLCGAMFAALVSMSLLRIGKPSVASGAFKKSVVLLTSFSKFDKRGCAISTQLLYAALLYKGSRWALGFFITSCAMLLDKMLPGFLFEAGIEIVIDSCCATFAEIHKRGEDLWDEFKSYVVDLLAGMLAPYACTRNQSIASGLNNSLAALPNRRFLPCSSDKDIAPSGSSNPGPRRSRKLNKTAKDQVCYHCGLIGHWKRNCLAYLAELKKGKSGSSNPGT